MLKPFLLLLAGLAATGLYAAEYSKMGEDIYDTRADAQVEIDAALQTAGQEHKNVLLMFGANWCVWCHRLHHTLTSDPAVATALKRDFVVVMIDVNPRNGPPRNAAVNERYGNPIQHGLPVLVVLGPDGTRLTTQETGALEEGNGHSPAKVLAFLNQWSPRQSDE